MKTKYWNVKDTNKNNERAVQQAARMLKEGKTVSFPTETVYGIGADATNEDAIDNIFQAKGRPGDNPLIAHVASKTQLQQLITELPETAERLIDAFTPGPITFVLPSNGTCAKNVTARLPTIAVRIPDHPIALKLLEACAIPIAAPSANLSGRPSPTTAAHVWEDLNGRIAGLIDDGPTGVGVESTVIDCSKETPIILRPGGISKEMIEAEIGCVLHEPTADSAAENPSAPGMKYTHYAPSVPLWIVDGNAKQVQKMINHHRQKGLRVGVMASDATAEELTADQTIALGNHPAEIALHIYEALRSFSSTDIDIIVCETFSDKGIGQAIMNRLTKAASVHVRDDANHSPI